MNRRFTLPLGVLVGLFTLMLAACDSSPPVGQPLPSGGVGGGGIPPSSQAIQVPIQTGVQLQTNVGQGVGLFVEYLGAGNWHVWSSCDTAISGYTCNFQVILTPQGANAITNTTLDPTDAPGSASPSTDGNSEYLSFTTGTTAVGATVTFNTPGAPVEIAYSLDGNYDPHYWDWASGGITHEGAPTDPLVFTPSAP